VDYSTEEEDTGLPFTSEGKSSAVFCYSTLKRAADDDSAGPSGVTTETVNRSVEASQPHITQGYPTHNRFAYLSQDEIFLDTNTQESTQSRIREYPRHKHTTHAASVLHANQRLSPRWANAKLMQNSRTRERENHLQSI